MARGDQHEAQAPVEVHKPQISLLGEVTDEAGRSFIDELRELAGGDEPITIEVSTLGGDAEVARRMVLEIDLARERLKPRRLLFLGKTTVYSAGTTIMSAFPREDRFLTHDAMLLIHCRQLEKTVEISGPMRGSLAEAEALCHQMKVGIGLEEDNFKRLIEGSDIEMEELLEKALYNWYVPAEEALRRGLVAGIV